MPSSPLLDILLAVGLVAFLLFVLPASMMCAAEALERRLRRRRRDP